MIKKALFLVLAVLLGAGAIVFLIQQTNTLKTTLFTWQHSRVPPEFEGFRIVQVSDLHNKRFGRGQRRLIHAIHEAQPDMIALTGDIIDPSTRNLRPVAELLEGIHGLAPIYYVDGNHDPNSWLYEDFLDLLERFGVVVLNSYTRLHRNGASMTLAGFPYDDLLNLRGNADIVLYHDPEEFSRFASLNTGLVIAGHNHGGQIATPGGRAVIGPQIEFFPTYSSGVYVNGDATMFLSRGLGTSRIPFRAFATPEIAVIELKPK